MNGDRTETNNVAADYPEKLQQMIQLFNKTNAAYRAQAPLKLLNLIIKNAPKTDSSK